MQKHFLVLEYLVVDIVFEKSTQPKRRMKKNWPIVHKKEPILKPSKCFSLSFVRSMLYQKLKMVSKNVLVFTK